MTDYWGDGEDVRDQLRWALAELTDLQGRHDVWVARAVLAEAALARVEALCDRQDLTPGVNYIRTDAIRAALRGDTSDLG